MKTLKQNIAVLLLILLGLQTAPSYAANEEFHGTFSGQLVIVNEDGPSRIQEFAVTFGDNETRIGEDLYVYLPNDSAFHIYSSVDTDGDFLESSVIIKDRTVFLVIIGQFGLDPAKGWADNFEFEFDHKSKKISFSGFEIDEDPNPLTNTGGEARGVLKRMN